MMESGTGVIILLAGVIIVIILYAISVYNKLKRGKVNIEEAFADIDAYLEERFDMLTKLISVVKEETKQEQTLLIKITELRTGLRSAKSIDEKVDAAQMIEQNMPGMNVQFENYPEVKFSEGYRLTQRSIVAIEDKLSAARRNFNSNISIYNKVRVGFPTIVFANLFGFKSHKMFQVTEHKREDIDLDNLWNK